VFSSHIEKWRICKLGLQRRQFKKALVNLKNSAEFKVRLARYSKVPFKKFKNGALVAILKNGGYLI